MRFTITRRTTFASVAAVVVSGCLWLLGTAMPVAADGGPHVGLANSGATTLAADSCGGCHRAHTAQGEMLLMQADEVALCLACHGETGTGATTNVEGGVQFASTNDGTGTGTVAGALRGGGFIEARIDTAHGSRVSYPVRLSRATYGTGFSSLVGVTAAGTSVTSAHMDLDGAMGVVARGVAWGNGALNSGAGPSVSLTCTSCHNPHGNGNYRILNSIPEPTGTGFVATDAALDVPDGLLPTGSGAAGTRNYTVQWGRTLKDVTDGTYVNNGFAGTPSASAGDYWRKYLPWDGVPTWNGTGITAATGHAGDVPEYVPGDADNNESYRLAIAGWCAGCHSRYDGGVSYYITPTGDAIYTHRHQTSRTECTQCHVAHGSNAGMIGESGRMTYPDGSAPTGVTSGDTTTYLNSRLLKIDNRGTCNACHDPTGTVPYTGVVTTK